MDKECAILNLDHFFINEKPLFTKIIIDNKEYVLNKMNETEIKIPFNPLEMEFGLKNVSITFVYSENTETHYFEIIPGVNTGFIFPNIGKTRDIIFPDEGQYKIEIKSMIDSKKQINKVINKRLLLINFDPQYSLYINGMLLTNQIFNIANELSLQICAVDLAQRLFFSKNILSQKLNSFFEDYETLSKDAKYFSEQIENISQNFESKVLKSDEEVKKLFFNNKLINVILTKHNLPKKILIEQYNKKDYFDYISSCCLYYILCNLENIEEIKSVYKYFIDYKKKLEDDKKLEYYKRNIIIMEFARLFKEKKTVDNFKNLEFKYYNINNLEKDSPLFIAIEFLKNLIINLDEESPFYYPLILIDSGNFTYNNENAYGFGLIDKKSLKSHLENIIPDVITTINDEAKNSYQAVANKIIGSVTLNLASKFLSKLKNIKLDKNIENKEYRENLSLILFFVLFHEIFGHKKGGFSSQNNKILNSPNVFYDKKRKKILKLVNRNFLFENENEVKILRDEPQDAGHFLEYFIGESNNYGFYSELIEIMLLNNINLNFIFCSFPRNIRSQKRRIFFTK